MAIIYPFQPYRYTPAAGPIDHLVTQPYDKISPVMRERYLIQSTKNLVRIILGSPLPTDDESDNVYTRAARHFEDWIRDGILAKDPEPGFYAYFQEFSLPESTERLVRKGFIGLGEVVDYSAKIVHRHEQTLSGPKKDRMEVLKHTHGHFGQIFMLYPDPDLAVDRILDEAAEGDPITIAEDEYGGIHRVWKITGAAQVARIQQLMSDKKLLIADGHHRYETALAFRDANPQLEDATKVMITFVNMQAPGLKILATHRVVSDLDEFNPVDFFAKVKTRTLASLDELKQIFATPAPDKVRIGIALPDTKEIHLLERKRKAGELDVKVLHEELLGQALGIGEEAVRDEKYLHYVRGLDAAYAKVAEGVAQIAFLLEATTIQQTADIAFSGGVMPQKSTDFFPKMLSGLTIYRLEK